MGSRRAQPRLRQPRARFSASFVCWGPPCPARPCPHRVRGVQGSGGALSTVCRPHSQRNQLLRSVLGKILGFCSWTPTPASVSSEVNPQGAGETPAGGQISSSARPAALLLPPTAQDGSARAPRAHRGSGIAAGGARTALTGQHPQRSGPSRRFRAVRGSLGCVFLLWQGTFREEGDYS